jgi:hypothetical protein
MEISAKRTGGFAGLTEELGSIDTEQLNETLGRNIAEALDNIDFFHLPSRIESENVMADPFEYEITVKEGKREHTITFRDDGSLKTAPLLQLVNAVSRGS